MAVGKTGRGGGAGVGDQWVKSGEWELGDHVTELFLFRFQIEMGESSHVIVLTVKQTSYNE